MSRFLLPGDGAPGRIRTVDTRFRRAVLYPLSYEGIDEMVSHGGYHVVENLAYDQREQHDARQREYDQQAKAARHDYLLVVHVSPLERKRRKPLNRHGGLPSDWRCLLSQEHLVILPLVVDLLAREDDVRIGDAVLVGKADVVTAPTDFLCNAGQRVTGLDDIAAITSGLHAKLCIDLGLDSIRIITGSGELIATVLTVAPGACDNLGGNGIDGLLADASASVDLSLDLVIAGTESTLALITVAPLASLDLVGKDRRLGRADVVDGILHLSVSGTEICLTRIAVSVHA